MADQASGSVAAGVRGLLLRAGVMVGSAILLWVTLLVLAALAMELWFPDQMCRFHPTARVAIDEDRDHGWLPERLPAWAIDVSECHNLDNNLVWISFRVTPDSLPALSAPATNRSSGGVTVRPPRGEEMAWPSWLAGPVNLSRTEARGYALHVDDTPHGSGVGWWWIPTSGEGLVYYTNAGSLR